MQPQESAVLHQRVPGELLFREVGWVVACDLGYEAVQVQGVGAEERRGNSGALAASASRAGGGPSEGRRGGSSAGAERRQGQGQQVLGHGLYAVSYFASLAPSIPPASRPPPAPHACVTR